MAFQYAFLRMKAPTLAVDVDVIAEKGLKPRLWACLCAAAREKFLKNITLFAYTLGPSQLAE